MREQIIPSEWTLLDNFPLPFQLLWLPTPLWLPAFRMGSLNVHVKSADTWAPLTASMTPSVLAFSPISTDACRTSPLTHKPCATPLTHVPSTLTSHVLKDLWRHHFVCLLQWRLVPWRVLSPCQLQFQFQPLSKLFWNPCLKWGTVAYLWTTFKLSLRMLLHRRDKIEAVMRCSGLWQTSVHKTQDIHLCSQKKTSGTGILLQKLKWKQRLRVRKCGGHGRLLSFLTYALHPCKHQFCFIFLLVFLWQACFLSYILSAHPLYLVIFSLICY